MYTHMYTHTCTNMCVCIYIHVYNEGVFCLASRANHSCRPSAAHLNLFPGLFVCFFASTP